MLEVRGLKAIDPGAASIEWLTHPAGDRRRAGSTAEGATSDGKLLRNNRVGQVFVKVARRDHPKGVYVVLDEDIHIIRGLGFEVWVAKANKNRIGGIVKRERLGDVLRIGTREATGIDRAQVSVMAQGESERGTRQHFDVGATAFADSLKRVVGIKNRSGGIKIGPLKPDASH